MPAPSQGDLCSDFMHERDCLRVTPPAPWVTESRSWHDVRQFLHLIRRPTKGSPAPTHEQCMSIAAEILATASDFAGDMQPEVKDFIRRNSPPSSSPDSIDQ